MVFEPFDLLDNFPTLIVYKLPIIVVISIVVLLIRFNLSATGAFEVSFNGDLVFSKLSSGKVATVKEIMAEIKRRE